MKTAFFVMHPPTTLPAHLLELLASRRSGCDPPVCGRFAPSPTGTLHLGNLQTALASFVQARRHQGIWRLRIDDLDTPRTKPGAIEEIQRDLRWLGLEWDGPVIVQSQHRGWYYSCLSWLRREGLLFPCRCSRRDLAGLVRYPGTCRQGDRDWGWQQGRLPSWRLRVPNHDPYGSGDVVLRRSDGFVAYQLATVLDDLRCGITDVVRGEDLREAEAAQRSVFAAFEADPPTFHYAPLLVDGQGEKLSKRDQSAGLKSLIDQGFDSPAVIGSLAFGLGWVPRGTRCSVTDLLHEGGPSTS